MSKPSSRPPGPVSRALRPAVLAAALAATASATAAEGGLRWEQGPGHRHAALPVPATGHAGFTLLDPGSIGIDFTNALAPDRVQAFQNLMNGAGLAAGDANGDGLVDLYFVNRQGPNQLYLNLGGGRFTNATAGSGAGCTNLVSTGAVFADVDGDGAPDLLVSSFGGPHALLHNDGRGHFTDVTAASGIGGRSGSTSMALADIDGDGDLDLYWCNFAVQAILRDGGMITTRMVNGQPQVTGRHANRVRIVDGVLYEFGDPDVLYLNDGKGKFTPMPWEQAFQDASGRPVPPPWDFGLAVQVRDVDGDGFPDIYVCDDFQTPDHLWMGDGRGHFREVPDLALRNMSYASMGVDFADIDRDGRLDFITVEMLDPDLRKHLRTMGSSGVSRHSPGQYRQREELPRNALYWNRGDGTWAEIANFAGVAATSWSWTPLFLDVDLDGWEDLLVSNGHLHDVNNLDVTERVVAKPGQSLQATKDMLLSFPPLDPPKAAFRNRHDLTFEDMGAKWGFDTRRMAHGMIAVDLDDDGDLDVVANTLRGQPLVFRNESNAPRVAVRVKGLAPNTGGVGARLRLTGGPVVQTQEILAGGQYLSHGQAQRTFAAGTGPMTLEVRWRSGRRSVVEGVRANRVYEVDEAGASPAPAPSPSPAAPAPLFADASALLGHTHVEDAFNDFEQQPLLPQHYSQLGPGVAWSDLDGDGRVDLVVGAGKGGPLAVFLSDGKGGFRPAKESAPMPEDAGAVVALPGAGGGRAVLAALANYETGGEPAAPAAVLWQPLAAPGAVPAMLPGGPASAGALAAGDVDGDGDLDVFVGARLTARRWPQPGGSAWFRNDGGRLVRDDAASAAFATAGPVADALLADLDGDGVPELVLACELGPVRVFRRDGTAWKELDPALKAAVPGLDPAVKSLRALTGWWNSVAAADFDGDGRLDLVVGNRGRNSSWETWGGRLPSVTWAPGVDGSMAVIESVHESGADRPVRNRRTLAAVLPDLVSRFPTHTAFAEADVAALARGLANPATLRAATLASVVLLNRGDHFEARALPAEAQWAPALGLAAADFDGDGHTDLFLAQNLFAVRPEDSRLDAGRGLLLRGDGHGGFSPVPGPESGVVLYGEQRGAAAADFDGDGRVDLVVAQNAGPTALYHNERARPGLRVRLRGGGGNPDAVGAVVRPVRGGVAGAAQAVTAGGGYWSQPDSTLVFGGAHPDRLSVRWPGGKTTEVAVPADAREVAVSPDGLQR